MPDVSPHAAETHALCAVCRLALARTEELGLVDDDRPELVLAVIERWCAGEATSADVRAVRWDLHHRPPSMLNVARSAIWNTLEHAVGQSRWRPRRVAGVLERTSHALTWSDDLRREEDRAAAEARVREVYEAAMRGE